ncbi:SAM domain-containing protein SAMSN-1b, partial [Tachysurus ichikawai]
VQTALDRRYGLDSRKGVSLLVTPKTCCCFSLSANSQREVEDEEAPKSPSATGKAEPNDCPRDSGCYIASDCSDNSSKEDTEHHLPAPLSSSPAEV